MSSSTDLHRVEELRLALASAHRPSPWWVAPPIQLDPNWRALAIQGIRRAGALLFVTSPRSVCSPHCLWELTTAFKLGRPCFQWIIEPVVGDHAAAHLPVLKTGDAADAAVWDFANAASRI